MIIETLTGYYVDDESGEVVGHEDIVIRDGSDADLPTHQYDYIVNDISTAEWVLGKMAEAEAQVMAIDARRAAINANLDAQTKPYDARITWLHRRFADELERFAAKELEGQKSRTLTTAFGKLGFRRTSGSIKVTDKDIALKWCSQHKPTAIKTVFNLLTSELKGMEDKLPVGGFEVTAPYDKFSVTTGIKSDA